jgi:polysaccharide export outer membrane protein
MARSLRIALSVSLGFVALLLLACGITGLAPENPRIPDVVSTAQLRPGDSLSVALLGVPDASNSVVQVDEQGFISLPFIGAIHASGTSAAELSQRVRQTYLEKKIYTAVDVSVNVTERFVYVGGEVVHPGRIVWTPDLTLTKAIQTAGGFTLYAREAKVSLTRDNAAYEINVQLAQKNPSQDPRLTPGDSIQVPRSAF